MGPRFEPADLSDRPIAGLDEATLARFDLGDELFDLSLRDADGLGPLYTRSACGQCHDAAARGPGVVHKFGVVMGDGVTPHPDQSRFLYGHTEVQGDAIPSPPSTWSAENPSMADLATPFGRLYTKVRAATDPTAAGSVVKQLGEAGALLGFGGT